MRWSIWCTPFSPSETSRNEYWERSTPHFGLINRYARTRKWKCLLLQQPGTWGTLGNPTRSMPWHSSIEGTARFCARDQVYLEIHILTGWNTHMQSPPYRTYWGIAFLVFFTDWSIIEISFHDYTNEHTLPHNCSQWNAHHYTQWAVVKWLRWTQNATSQS